MQNTVVYMYLHSYKLIFLFVILDILNIKRNPNVKCISHCICYSNCQNTIYWEWKKGGIWQKKLRTEELDAQHYAPCTLNCMYVCFIACYYELLMHIYLNCDIDTYNCD